MGNLTLPVPPGSTYHADSKLLCIPPRWFHLLLFYVSNYFAHAATVLKTPRQGRKEMALNFLGALLLPGSGNMRALEAIVQHSTLESDPIKRALRAGALCMVVRIQNAEATSRSLEEGRTGVLLSHGEQHTANGADKAPEFDIADMPLVDTASVDTVTSAPPRRASESRERRWWAPDSSQISPVDGVVHGQYDLPHGYVLAVVPREAASDLRYAEPSHTSLAASYNLPKLAIGLMQAIWGVVSLYRARGTEIQEYGYAAPGLTVTPYAFMSLTNIVGSLLNYEYPACFLVRTPLMDEAESKGGFFSGEVCSQGARSPEHPYQPPRITRFFRRRSPRVQNMLLDALDIVIGCVPLAVNGALSSFEPQNSSTKQRFFTMSWVVMGILGGPIVRFVRRNWVTFPLGHSGYLLACLFVLYFSVPAIGGMTVVRDMIQDWGVCWPVK